jgi:capsular polysaccharide biosynthesis protein
MGQTDRSFGVFTDKGVFVKESTVWRSRGNGKRAHNYMARTLAIPESYPAFDCDAVYLGDIDDKSFGHHLLENWNRAYALLNEKYRDMKFVIVNSRRLEIIPEFMVELAHFSGIKAENFVVLNETTLFRNVYVPQQSFMIEQFSTKEFGEIYTRVAENVKSNSTSDKIYVSRAALKLRKIYGEEKVQSIFEKNGYHIVYPEQHSLEEQIALMKNCKSLAGCAGTALHLALFMPSGGNVIQLKRNKKKIDNCKTQYLITENKELGFTLIEASIEKYKTGHFVATPQIIGVNRHLKRFFDDSGFNYSSSDIEFDKQAYEEYIKTSEDFFAHFGKSRFEIKLLKIIVRIAACFIPSRFHRNAFRKKAFEFFGVNNS